MTGRPELADFEADLRRRLADVAATTTLDAQAWEKIESRAAAERPRRLPRIVRTRRQIAAVAAVVVIVVGLVVLSRQGDDSRTETVDTTTTTTSEGATSSTTARDGTTSTSTGELPQRPGSSTGQGTGPSTDGPGAGGGSEGGPAGTGPESGTGSSGGTSGGATPSTAPPPSGPGDTAPDGHRVVASIGQSGYTVDASAFESGGTYYMDLWRDRTQYLAEWSWSPQPGQRCLAGQGGAYSGGELGALRWGFVRSDAASVRMVTTSGNTSTAILGAEFAPGLRAWIGPRPPGQVDRFEALDAGGNVLHTAAAPVWDASPDSC
jgi:hypothetical protein